MNERLKELARQAKPSPNLIWEKAELERFAELVRQDERAVHALFAEKIQQDLNVYKAIVARFKQQLEQGVNHEP